MVFSLPDGLAPEVYPLAWLVGTWRGQGTVGYPGIPEAVIVQEVVFGHDGGPYLDYSSQVRLLDENGEPGTVWHAESGYWRAAPSQVSSPAADAPADPALRLVEPDVEAPADGPAPTEIEVLLSDPAGFLSLYLGRVAGPRIDLSTDLMARTASASPIEAATRMYGLVASDLLWVWDIAAFGHPLGSYMAARLSRVE